MPIDFPIGPATGQTYSYGINRWIYNGVAWDKLDNHPGISAGNQISVGYQESLSGASFSINVIEGHGSDLDADLLDGVSGERFIENLQTGVLYGGLVSINAGNTATFDVSAGAGIIVNIGGSTTGYPTPTLTNVSWTAKTGVTTGYLGSTEETFISINSSGNLVLQSTAWSEAQYESQIPIGTLFHHGTGYIDLAISIPHVSYGQAQQFDPFIRAFGPLKLNGYELTGSTADFKIYKSSGKAYLMGRNYAVDPNNPNVVTDTASNPVQYYYMFYRDGSGGFDTTILTTGTDVTNYDDGTGILNSAPSGKYTTQRIFGLPNQPNVLGIYYGREIYNSLEDAKANIQYETFSESEATSTQGVFLGYLVCKANATNLGTTGDHEFIASGLFRNTSNIGGGGLAFSALTDLSDVNISSPSNNQALIYDSSTSAWVNKSFSDLPVVTSFNGLTGAVSGVGSFNGSTGAIVGVNSIRGLTGVVGITNGSGIGLSVSGQTMTFSNTGVLSIDGGTGAITNVARTNVSNIFTANQLISAPFTKLSIVNTVLGVTSEYSASNITHYSGTNTQTISFNPTNPTNTITLPNVSTTLAGLAAGQTFTQVNTFNALTNFPGGISAAGATFSSLARFNAGISAAGGTFSGTQTFINGATFTGNISAPNIVNSVRGLTGAVGITNGSGIGLSVSGQTMTFSNTGVLSIDGGTGAITNVARTNVINYFTESQSIAGTGKALTIGNFTNSVTVYPTQLEWYNDLSSTTQYWVPNTSLYPSTITFPDETGTLALTKNVVSSFNGLTGAVTGVTTGVANTFGPLQSFTSGISAAGATFSSLVRFNAGISSAGATFTGDINLNSDIYHKTDNNSSFLIQQHYSPAPGAYSPTTFINLGVLGMALGYTGSGNAVKLIGGLEIDGSSTSIFTNHTPLKIKGTTLNGSPTQSMTDWINPSNTVLSSILPSGGYSGPASSFSGLVSANAGISAAGATFSSLAIFNAGISAAGGTFGNAISVNGFYETANSIRVTNNARSWFL